MLDDIALVRDLGFPGLVTGLLDEEGNVDVPRMRQVMAAAKGMAVTFHRAFDMCKNHCKPLIPLRNLAWRVC